MWRSWGHPDREKALLNLLGCLDHPTSGKYELSQTAVEVLNDQELSSLRAKSIGLSFSLTI